MYNADANIIQHFFERRLSELNKQLLRDTIKNSGMSVTAIAKRSGMVRETLYNKIESGNFYASEILALTRALRLTREERDAIFFKD